jgi:hypothetical protein
MITDWRTDTRQLRPESQTPNLPQHTYEEIRDLVIHPLLNRDPSVNQFLHVLEQVALRLEQRHPIPQDKALLPEAFWDYFDTEPLPLEWILTLTQAAGLGFAWAVSPYIALDKSVVHDLLREAELYLEEACAASYVDGLLASTVMLGVAAEAEFLRLINAAAAKCNIWRFVFVIGKKPLIKSKIIEFQKRLTPHLNVFPKKCTEDLDTNLSAIHVLGIARKQCRSLIWRCVAITRTGLGQFASLRSICPAIELRLSDGLVQALRSGRRRICDAGILLVTGRHTSPRRRLNHAHTRIHCPRARHPYGDRDIRIELRRGRRGRILRAQR